MARVVWKGSISFGLVNVPVALYSGERRNELHFSMLDKRNMAPVGYTRVNKRSGEEVPWGEIVKGYEYEKGQYVVLGEEDFRRANVEATQSVQIVGFVDGSEIPMMYYDKPYYLEPVNKSDKGYALLREALRRTGKVGIAKVVLRTREHLAALAVCGDVLMLDLLRYHHELRQAGEFKVPHGSLSKLKISDRELEMAQRLVEDMAEPWRPEQYQDEYRDDLLNVIDEKIRSGRTHVVAEPPAVAPAEGAEVIDLMSLLKRSLEENKKPPARAGASAGTRRAARRSGTRKRAKG